MRTTRQSSTRYSSTPIVACVTVAVLALVAAPSLRAQQDEVEPGRLVQGDPDPPGAVGDGFGSDVSVSGDTAVVGAPGKDDAGTDSGAVYVFERSQADRDQWTQVAKLAPDDARAGLRFGSDVAIDGDTIVVGAVGNTELGELVGAAYVFQRDPVGSNRGRRWRFSGAMKYREDCFGASVAIDDDTVIVGEPGFNSLLTPGAAYVFARHHGGTDIWGEVQKLRPNDTGFQDGFGSEISISGDTVVIGAPGLRPPASVGAAYVFTRTELEPGVWKESAKLTTSGYAPDFGHALSVDGGTAIIVASYGLVSHAYVFERDPADPSAWNQTAILSGGFYSDFGDPALVPIGNVSISGDVAIVGLAYGTGSAKVFHRNQGGAGAWGELFRLRGSVYSFATQGVAVSGTVAILGDIGALGSGIGGAYACPLETVSYTSGACRFESHVLNDSFTMSDLTTACCDGNIFTITATFTNNGMFSVHRPYFEVTSPLTGRPWTYTYATGVEEIAPGESMTVPFRVPVRGEPFRFYVDLRGQPVQ